MQRGRQSPDAFMAQRNTPYNNNNNNNNMGGAAYERMPEYDPHFQHQQQQHHSDNNFVEGALASTSGSSSSQSHNVMPSQWSHHPSNARDNSSTPPRTSYHQQLHHESHYELHDAIHAMPSTTHPPGRFAEGRARNTGVNPPVHYRTNFGKNCSYFPPSTKSSPGRLPPDAPVAPRRDTPPSPKRLPPAVLENIAKARALVFQAGQAVAEARGYHAEGEYAAPSRQYGNLNGPNYVSTWEDDDVPFDQQRDMFRPPSTTASFHSMSHGNTRDFDASLEVHHQETPPRGSQSDREQSSPDRPVPIRTYYSEPDDSVTGRFQISPPRVTDPKPLPQQSKNELDKMLMSMGHEAYIPPNVYSPGPTAYHAPGNRFFGRPLVHGEPGYDSMEAECSPSRTHESTSLYSPYSQNTRGSQFRWPDDSPRSKNLESPTSRHTASVHSSRSLHSVKGENSHIGALSQPGLHDQEYAGDEELLDSIPVDHAQFEDEFDEQDARQAEEYEPDHAEDFELDQPEEYEPQQPHSLAADRLPDTKGPHYPSLVSTSQESENEAPPRSPKAPSEQDSTEMEPFDVQKNTRRSSEPPVIRISEESPFEVEGSWDEMGEDFPDPEDELPTSSAADETSPQSLQKKHSTQTDEDSIFVFTDDDRNGRQRSSSEKGLSPKQSLSPTQSISRKKGLGVSQRRGRRRTASESDGDDKEDDDDTSLENDYGVAVKPSSGLQERAQQAWASRKSGVHRSQSVPTKPAEVVPILDHDTSSAPRQTDEDDITALTGATGASGGPSFAGSLNSLYSKTLESEVEDAIKDLLLIGTGRTTNPGRRANKFQPATKRVLKEGEENSSALEDEATEITPLDDETETMDDTFREEKKEADNPIQLMWEYMEGNLSVIGSAFGLAPEAEIKPKTKTLEQSTTSADEGSSFSPKIKSGGKGRDRSIKKKKKSKLRQDDKSEEIEYTTITVKSQSRDFVDDGEKSRLSTISQISEKKLKVPEPEPVEIIEESVELDESTAFGGSVYSFQPEPLGESLVDPGNQDTGASLPLSPVAHSTVTQNVSVRSVPLSISRNGKLEEDPRLIELALDAARSLHQLAGVQFDDSGGIDIVEDVRFSIVKLALPLGILFQENNGGCWVTRILPSGNAAKIGGIELGDQLAAVNGVSAIKAKVDEVCTLVSETAVSSAVELTFLRYIGPLRAQAIVVEEDVEELPADDEPNEGDTCQAQNVFSCVIKTVKDEPTAQTEPDETSRPEEKPRKELSEMQPGGKVSSLTNDPRQKNSDGKKRFRFFGLGRKKNSA